jgi:SNF2 family DNA or RNA helicase
MARVKELALGRSHQVAAYRYARQVLNAGPGGIILADGVGLGKTYEALATIATTLSSREHGKKNKQRQPYRVLVVVPPRLITKWADELLLADRFPKYLKGWSGSLKR